MKTWLYIPFIVLLLFSRIITAQKIIALPAKSVDFAKRKVHISKVIDDRLYRGSIGDVHTSLVNITKPAQFELPLAETLFKFYSKNFPPLSTTVPMVLIVKELRVEEHITTYSETGIAKVRVLLAEEDSNGSFLIRHAYADLVENGGLDVTSGHGKRIGELLRNVMTTQAYSIPQTPYSYTLAFQKPFDPLQWSQKLKQGLYATFEDLYTNQSVPFTGKVIERESDMVLQDLKGNKVEGQFAFYDGSRLFINTEAYLVEEGRSFEPVLELGQYLYFEDKVYNPIKMWWGASFGITGVLVAAGTAPDCGVVDMVSGKIIGLNNGAMEQLLASYPDLLSKYEEGSKTKQSKRFFIKELNQRIGKAK